MVQGWVQMLQTASSASGVIVANTTSTTSIIPYVYNFPADYWNSPGQSFRIRSHGIFSTAGSAPTFTLQFFTAGSAVYSITPTGYIPSASLTNVSWQAELNGTWNVLGSSATASLLGRWQVMTGTGLSDVAITVLTTATGVAIGDATAPMTFDLQATWGTASSSNSITLYEYKLEVLV